MPALQVRDFPEELYEQLRIRAKQEHRSIAQQTVVAVDYYLHQQNGSGVMSNREKEIQERIAERKALFEWINSRPPHTVPEGFPSVEELIREDRDSR